MKKRAYRHKAFTNCCHRDSPLAEVKPGHVRWCPTVESDIWCGVGFTFKLEMAFRDLYKVEIAEIRRSVGAVTAHINVLDEELQKSSAEKSDDGRMVDELKRRTCALDRLQSDLGAETKTVAEWCRKDGYAKFYQLYASLDQGQLSQTDTVNAVLVTYGIAMRLGKNELRALVDVSHTQTKEGEARITGDVLSSIKGIVLGRPQADGAERRGEEDVEVCSEPKEVKQMEARGFDGLHQHPLRQLLFSCPACLCRRTIFECAVGCDYRVCVMCRATFSAPDAPGAPLPDIGL